ncbi:lysophospholipase L1-like esterase [Algoriphagus aquaeductus]|uniref:Lysophospholipase L1-like esterase n=1 Tax=Algoriphagus aquaeductus TaxID=475299 RepID=A0A326RYS8_9BACT|nr:GDSL-type esterase/lipase family protein [Algoriphagus aquaeductus]PZV85558.1 lysophospholipase L1-like esterase [Algoriphagus aquaeductus]
MNRFSLQLFFLLALISQLGFAQQVPFENEVKQISAKYDSLGWKAGSTVFTGSSTIRMWSNLEETFPQENLINTGFGGSKAADLERHLFPLVIKFEPARVFIYEGDNDIWAGVEVAEILTSLDNIVTRIHLINPEVEIYLIGAKPSPLRWEKKANYQIFNQKLSEYCLAKEKVEYVDTWKAFINSDGKPRPELYIQDQLHLNQDGYLIWGEIFKPYFPNQN